MSILITVEGLDGSGKSTLVKNVVNELTQQQIPWVYASKEPGSMWSGKIPSEIRKMVLETPDLRPIERELLFYVDASLHRRFIANQGNAVIVSDRGVWSHKAYLRGYLKTRQIDWSDYTLCLEMIEKVCSKPDAVVYLKADLDLMKVRNFSKPKDVIERNSDQFFSSVLETYEDLTNEAGFYQEPVLILDAKEESTKLANSVVNWLKGVFTDDELRQGNREIC